MLVPVLVAKETGMLDRKIYEAAPTNLGLEEEDLKVAEKLREPT
jgi:hypothetical protein